jgi:hypothetical protein
MCRKCRKKSIAEGFFRKYALKYEPLTCLIPFLQAVEVLYFL